MDPMDTPRPPYGAAALAGLAAFALYALTLAPTTAFWDTSEYIATAHILGVPHPPGNPLFVVLARVWLVLLEPTGLSVAVRVNLLAAVTTSAAVFFFYLVAHRVAAPLLDDDRRGRIAAGASALLGATAYTVWNQANVNEKVYTLSVLVIAAVTWLALRWRDRRGEPGSDRYLLTAVFLMVLGSTNHLMSMLPAPALAVFVLMTDPRVLLRTPVVSRAVALVALGLSFNFFLPIRAAQDPVINEGDPVCESAVGAATAVFTNGKAGCEALAYNLTRGQYQKPSVSERQAPLGAQLENYWQYFGWQWARGLDPSELPGTARLPVNLLFLALGLAGLWAAFRVDRAVFAYLGTLAATLTVGLVYYLNFKYGFSLVPEGGAAEVRERDYFFVASFLLWGTLAGLGLAWAWGAATRALTTPRGALATSPVLALAFLPLAFNWAWADRSGDWAARDWAYDLLMSVEPYAVLFTNGDNDTFPLWYMQEVEGVRKDVTVIVGQYLMTDWYPKQLVDLTRPENQRPFDPAQGGGIFEAPAATPSAPITDLTDEQLDQIGSVRLDRDVSVPLGALAVTYPEGMGLNREHQIVLSIIADSIDERPVYFAASGGTMAQIGLDRWGVRHGLATRFLPRTLDGPQPEGVVQGSPEYGGLYYDVPRSLHLYRNVYQFRSIRDRDIWQDRSTLMIPWMFYATALQLSDVGRSAGVDPEVLRRLEDDAMAFQVVAQGGSNNLAGT